MSPAILFLLTLIAKEQIIFCGDTAQTIAKGVNFRFSDLKKLFFHGRSIKESNDFPNLTKNIDFKILNVYIMILIFRFNIITIFRLTSDHRRKLLNLAM